MKSFRAVLVLSTLLFFAALVGCNASNNTSDPAPENNTNEQEVAIAVALTQTATAIQEEAPLPEPEISEVTAVPEESTPEPEATSSDPVVEETTNDTDCPIPEITTNAKSYPKSKLKRIPFESSDARYRGLAPHV